MINEEESDGEFKSPKQTKPLNTNNDELVSLVRDTLNDRLREANDQPYPQQKELSSRSSSVGKDFKLPKVNDVVKFENKGGDQWTEVSVISRGGKAKEKCSTWFNIKNLQDGTQSCVDFQSISKREKLENTNEIVNLLNIIKDKPRNSNIIDANKKELLNR